MDLSNETIHFLDLDGTLLDSGGDWSLQVLTRENLRLPAEFPTKAIIVTGRGKEQYRAIEQLFKAEGRELMFILCRPFNREAWMEDDDFMLKYWYEKGKQLRHLRKTYATKTLELWDDDRIVCAMAYKLGYNVKIFSECKQVGSFLHKPTSQEAP